ncbi:TPA: hypothetical protein N0F65_009951 [Lagenidium giganteum]|uniref:Uncharacterized protein n=1 Tax=Lagenidium giganteum TaxID=4803 RepID=A0AAV2YVN5_9STRA|nr:TPA: hypothetical protein N0F65_009951 [Lagenidium giganteum]
MSCITLKSSVRRIDESNKEHYVTYRIRTDAQDPNDVVTVHILHFDFGNGEEWLTWRKQFDEQDPTVPRETPKPFDMTIEQYLVRLHQINDMIRLLPPQRIEVELREIVEANVPTAWQKKYDESGQDYEALDELVAYFRQLEEAENQQQQRDRHRNQPKDRGASNSDSNRSSNRPGQQGKKKSAPSGSNKQKWCEPHKTHSHDSAECRERARATEKSHFIDIDIEETC